MHTIMFGTTGRDGGGGDGWHRVGGWGGYGGWGQGRDGGGVHGGRMEGGGGWDAEAGHPT